MVHPKMDKAEFFKLLRVWIEKNFVRYEKKTEKNNVWNLELGQLKTGNIYFFKLHICSTVVIFFSREKLKMCTH